MTELDMHRNPVVTSTVERTGFRLSWGDILAGVVVATALQVVLSVLGLAIGLGAWDTGDAIRPFGIGAAVWVLATSLLSLFVGGLTTGHLAGVLTRGDGMLHGVVLWGVSVLFTVWLVGSGAGTLLGGAFNVLGRTASAVAGGATNVVGQIAGRAVGGAGSLDANALQREVETALRQSGVPALRPESLRAAARDAGASATGTDASNSELGREIVSDIERRAGQVDREAVVNVIAARTNLSRAEADQVADRIENAVANARTRLSSAADTIVERAGDVVDAGTDKLSGAAWWTLLALGLSAAAAAFGASRTALG